MAQLVEALRYKPEGLGFDFLWSFRDLLLTTLPATDHPCVDSASNRNEFSPSGKGGRCVGLTTLPPSCVDCLKILGASTSCSSRSLSRPLQG